MIKFFAVAGLLGITGLFGLGRFERSMIWPLDITYETPQQAGVMASEQRVTMQDGTEIIAWAAAPTPGKPIVLYFHGNAGNLANRGSAFNWFLSRGYGLVAMSYRGSSGSEGTAIERSISSDAHEIYNKINFLTGTQDHPIVIYGESIGASVGIALAADLQDDPRLKGLVLEAPFTSIPDVIRLKFPQFRALLFALKNRWPSEDRIRSITTPLLVIHGTEDMVTAFEMGRAIHAAAASPHKEFIAVTGAGHDNTWQPYVIERLDQFLSTAQISNSDG